MKRNKELEKAVLLGNIADVKSVIKVVDEINLIDKDGRTVLYDAIVKGYEDIVIELCSAGSNVNVQDKSGKTPLHFASIHNQYSIAKILIGYGADVNTKDENGNTPIFDAIFYSNGIPDIILLLKENRADYSSANNYGISPKELAESIANFNVAYIFD